MQDTDQEEEKTQPEILSNFLLDEKRWSLKMSNWSLVSSLLAANWIVKSDLNLSLY